MNPADVPLVVVRRFPRDGTRRLPGVVLAAAAGPMAGREDRATAP
ncbi:hypothetical protein [Streptomyces sp. NPDC007991]